MPTIKNMSYGPLSVARADKDPLTLGPRETADITDVDFDSDEIQRHLRDRRIAVVPEAAPAEKSSAPEEAPAAGGAPAHGAPAAEGGGGRPRPNERRGSGALTPAPSE